MHKKNEKIQKMYNRNNFYYIPSFITAFTFFCMFYILTENSLFSQNYYNSQTGMPTGSLGLGRGREFNRKHYDSSQTVEASKGKYIDYFKEFEKDEDLQDYLYVPIKHISSGISFDENLTVHEYQILIRDKVHKMYPDLHVKSAVSKYFFRALAENLYSLDGYLPADKFNSIVDARETYFKINGYIDTLKIKPDVRRALKELYIFACIYMQKVDESLETLQKLKKIPLNCVVFQSKNQKASPFGEYVADKPGESLYYICSAFYSNFTELPKEKQVEVLDQIYSFNPTVRLSPPIIKNYDFYNWILSILPSSNKSKLLRYSVNPYIGWLILPKTIYFN